MGNSFRVLDDITSTDRLTATACLILYGGSYSKETAGHCLSLHRIETNPEHPELAMIGEGKLVTRSQVVDLLKRLQGIDAERATFLPGNVLCKEADRLIWFRPGSKREMFFVKRAEARLETVSGVAVMHPGLIFVAEEHALTVYAVKTRRRPDLNTRLYRAPYYNLYENSRMCLGTAVVPTTLEPETIPQWESAFFDSEFSGTVLKHICRHPGGHDALWSEVKATGKFDNRWLLPLSKTMESLLR